MTTEGELETVCSACGKPFQKGASMTQWIFDANKCTCSVESTTVSQLPNCALCGLPIRTKLGSITHWIFKTPVCECLAVTEEKAFLSEELLPSDDLIPGSPYQFLAVTGAGGIATVYKAQNRKLERNVAIKILQTGLNDSRAVENFEREAKAASKLQHPNIVIVQDFGKMRDGRQFLVTEWIDGITLADYLQRNGPLSLDATKELFTQVLDGLTHAHNRGVVHRDIKPSNIMLARGGSGGWIVKIIDFGTAKEIDNDGERTRAEDMTASPFYMSPEQATGEKVDARSDLYSLGCSMFEALTGRTPFVGKPLSVVMRHQLEEAPTLNHASGGLEFSDALEALIAKALSKNPSGRYQNAQEMKDALQAASIQAHSRFNQRLYSFVAQPENSITASPLVVIGVIVVAVAFPIGVWWLIAEKSAPNVVRKERGEKRTSKVTANANESLVTRRAGDYWYGVSGVRHELPLDKPLTALPAKQVRQLVIGHNSIHAITYPEERPFVERRFDGLETLTNLNCLAVWDIPITPEAVQKISGMHNLTKITISETDVPADTVRTLSVLPKLQIFDLKMCNITPKDIRDIGRHKSLYKLSLDNNPVGHGRGLAPVGTLEHLGVLSINNVGLDDEGIECLSKLAKLQYLFAQRAELSQTGMKTLSRFTQLKAIDLSFSTIDDEGLKELAKLKSLDNLNISGCPKLTDRCVDSICQLKGLTQLDVMATAISDQGLIRLEEGLPKLVSFRHVGRVDAVDPLLPTEEAGSEGTKGR